MLPIALDCKANEERSGAAGVAIFFLVVFAVLIVADLLLTAYAIWKTIRRKPPEDCIPPEEEKDLSARSLRRAASSCNARYSSPSIGSAVATSAFNKKSINLSSVVYSVR